MNISWQGSGMRNEVVSRPVAAAIYIAKGNFTFEELQTYHRQKGQPKHLNEKAAISSDGVVVARGKFRNIEGVLASRAHLPCYHVCVPAAISQHLDSAMY